MDYLKALYVNGKVVTGLHHGDAFSKLSEEEKSSASLLSGFWNRQSGKFLCDDRVFYTKRIVLIRHSLVDQCGHDPGLSDDGHRRAERMSECLAGRIDFAECGVWCSPYRRCLETAYHIARHTGMRVQVDPRLAEAYSPPYQGEDHAGLVRRLEEIVESLPENAVLCSHCNLIGKLAQLVCGEDALEDGVPPASITYIENHRIAYFGKGPYFDEEVCHQGRPDQRGG